MHHRHHLPRLDDGEPLPPALLASAAQRASEALEAFDHPPPFDRQAVAFEVGEHLGACCRALRRSDRVALLDGLVALLGACVRGRPLLVADDATPLARTLELASEDLDATLIGRLESSWVEALLDHGGVAIEVLLLLDEDLCSWEVAEPLLHLGACALEAFALFGQP